MKIIFSWICFCAFSLSSFLFAEPIKIVVSVAPIKFVVDFIGKERVMTTVIVPAGASPHSYEPSGKQALTLIQNVMWFKVGEGFETRITPSLHAANPSLDMVDLPQHMDLLKISCCCHEIQFDPHIWLSTSQLRKIALCICEKLISHEPEMASFYQKNLAEFIAQLENIEILSQKKLSNLPSRSFATAHAAFGYFCRDYHLKQLSFENEGRQPTPKAVIKLIEEARKENVHLVFGQPQYNPKGSKLVAAKLNARLVVIDPYQEDVLTNLQTIILELAKGNP